MNDDLDHLITVGMLDGLRTTLSWNEAHTIAAKRLFAGAAKPKLDRMAGRG